MSGARCSGEVIAKMGESLGKCGATLTDKKSPDRGRICGRRAMYLDREDRPVCGYHEPVALERRIALALGLARPTETPSGGTDR